MDLIETLRKHEKEIKARYSVNKVNINIFTAGCPKILLAHPLSALSALSAVSKYENRNGIVYGA